MSVQKRQLNFGQRTLVVDGRPQMIGILNLTPDSFSDGGDFDTVESALVQCRRMIADGASIIDIGGESTRPGYTPVSVEEEIRRVVPVIQKIRDQTSTLISIDTSKAAVAEAALDAGADIVNDVWATTADPEMAALIGARKCGCILMHNRSADEAGKGDVVSAALVFLESAIQEVIRAGGTREGILIDPGLGFGKTYEENWEIMRRLTEFHQFGVPVVLGASRKSMIAKLLSLENPKERVNGTLATTCVGVVAGVEFFRVHDVRANREAATVVYKCRKS